MSIPRVKLETKLKDPDAHLDFGEDWGTGTVIGKVTADWLEEGEIVEASEWFIEGADADLTQSADAFEDKTTTVWLDGGTVDVTYTLTNRVTTSAGRIDDRSMLILVKER